MNAGKAAGVAGMIEPLVQHSEENNRLTITVAQQRKQIELLETRIARLERENTALRNETPHF